MIAAAVAATALTHWRIDYVSNWAGRNAVYSVEAGGDGTVDTVSADPTADLSAVVPSPDGRHVVLFRDSAGLALIARADGNGERPLDTSVYRPTWSPDSGRIAYLTFSAGAELHVARADGSDDRVVSRNAGSDRIVWSRDSRHVRGITARRVSASSPSRPTGAGRPLRRRERIRRRARGVDPFVRDRERPVVDVVARQPAPGVLERPWDRGGRRAD